MSYLAFNTKARNANSDDDKLLDAVLALPPTRLFRQLERLIGRGEVSAVGVQIKLKRESPEKYPERNADIRRRYAAGETQGQLALDYGLTPSGIAKIIQRGRRRFSLDAESASIPICSLGSQHERDSNTHGYTDGKPGRPRRTGIPAGR